MNGPIKFEVNLFSSLCSNAWKLLETCKVKKLWEFSGYDPKSIRPREFRNEFTHQVWCKFNQLFVCKCMEIDLTDYTHTPMWWWPLSHKAVPPVPHLDPWGTHTGPCGHIKQTSASAVARLSTHHCVDGRYAPQCGSRPSGSRSAQGQNSSENQRYKNHQIGSDKYRGMINMNYMGLFFIVNSLPLRGMAINSNV